MNDNTTKAHQINAKMDNSDPVGFSSLDFIEECSEDSDEPQGSRTAPLREQDRFLPIANIAKIMKRAIPENGKVFDYKIILDFHCFMLVI